MFLFEYFYGTSSGSNKNDGSGKNDEDWVLVDPKVADSLLQSIDSDFENESPEEDEGEVVKSPNEALPLAEPLKSDPMKKVVKNKKKRGKTSEEEKKALEVQNPPRVHIAKNKTLLQLVGSSSGGVSKNNNQQQEQLQKIKMQVTKKRADKYKSGFVSGKSNDRKCGKCF